MHTAYAWVIVALTAIVLVNMWANRHDKEVVQAAHAYEKCVQQEYHMTPIRWYEQNGKYPECGN